MGTTTVNGVGNASSQPMMSGMPTVKKNNYPNTCMAGVRQKTKTAKKPLNYNPREISGQLVRVKKAQGAATVMTRAKSRLAILQRAAGTGQYDTRELANAIAHARRMVRCAQLKVRNLEEEEREQKAHSKESSAQKLQKQGEIKRRVAQKERKLKQKITLEESQEVLREKSKRNEMIRKRRMHRNQEQGKINEADMKYIKGQMENGRGFDNGSYSAMGQGAVLDLSLEAAALAEVQMLEQQIQAEVEAEVTAEMAMETGGIADAPGSTDMGNTAADSSAGAETVSTMDVSV